MKFIFAFLFLTAMATATFAQLANENSFSVQVDGKKYDTQPRRIRIGNYWWVTANSIKPDRSVRIWLGSYDHKDIIETGTYLIVDADKPDTKENKKKIQDLGKYKGIAIVKYVEETREPRMEYHVGKSQNNDETIDVTMGSDGFLQATFSSSLAGSYWKEKATATVFGGVGRLINKMEDKAITKTTGYDSDIDPEGRGYAKQSKTDTITLTNGTFKLKMN